MKKNEKKTLSANFLSPQQRAFRGRCYVDDPRPNFWRNDVPMVVVQGSRAPRPRNLRPIGFIWIEKRFVKHPTVPFDILGHRTSLIGFFSTFIHGVVPIAASE